MTFRQKLLLYGCAIVLILAAPLCYVEVQRPWQELRGLVGNTEAWLGGLVPAFTDEDLARMNLFVLDVMPSLEEPNRISRASMDYRHWSVGHAFNLLMDEQRLLPEAEVRTALIEQDLRFQNFDYALLVRWYQFWETRFARQPGLEGIFRKYRRLMLNLHHAARQSGFPLDSLYVVLDCGSQAGGTFRDHVAFMLGSLSCWKAVYPGQTYNLVETGTESWRRSYDAAQGGRLGFHHNQLMDPNNAYLPEFNTDDWGTWFSGWIARLTMTPGYRVVYNTFNIDFDAAQIRTMMVEAGLRVVAMSLVLVLLIVLATRYFSRWLSRPIAALIDGSRAVMGGRYEHRVPSMGRDEFARLIEVFNLMVAWIQERVNLKETLTKLLSAELADQAAREGLVLGGQSVDCTIVFTDFAGFSTLTRHLPAEDAVRILNDYFGLLVPIVKRHGGFPDKFIGDGIVAIFGAPVRFPRHAEHAVRCAIEMQQAMRRLNTERRGRGQLVFEMRIGINSGMVVAGAIGCDLKLEYTSIGETTNRASRMESKCRIGHILISADTYNLVKAIPFEGARLCRTGEKEVVKGYAEPVSAYGVFIDELEITKNPNPSAAPADFYQYGRMPPLPPA